MKSNLHKSGCYALTNIKSHLIEQTFLSLTGLSAYPLGVTATVTDLSWKWSRKYEFSCIWHCFNIITEIIKKK